MFIEEIIKSFYENDGKIELSEKYSVDDIKRIVFTSMKNTNRFNGLTERPYCLIEHSWLVSKYSQDLYKIYNDEFSHFGYNLVGLFGIAHDIGEVIVGDIVYPIKNLKECKNCLEPLEEKFVDWFLEKVFGFEGYIYYKNHFQKECEYVNKADFQIGTFEMIGISINDNFVSKNQFNKLLEENLNDIDFSNSMLSFENRIKFLIKEMRNE